MKKNGIVNSSISHSLSIMRHTDKIAIGDVGLPVPLGVKEIDIAVTFGSPSFLEVLVEVINDLKVEKIILAEEIKTSNEIQFDNIKTLFTNSNIKIEFVKHDEFKELLQDVKAVIRTGEITPYSNIILQSDITF